MDMPLQIPIHYLFIYYLNNYFILVKWWGREASSRETHYLGVGVQVWCIHVQKKCMLS